MTDLSREELFRRAAEDEDGCPVSAGARVGHVLDALRSGRGIYVDLSRVPEANRPAVEAEIRAVVNRASLPSSRPTFEPLASPSS